MGVPTRVVFALSAAASAACGIVLGLGGDYVVADGGAAGEGGGDDGGGSGGSGGGLPTPAMGSYVLVSNVHTMNGVTGAAQGVIYGSAGPTSGCNVVRTEGSCNAVRCPSSAPPAQGVSAGTLTIMGNAGAPITMPFDAGSYAATSEGAPFFAPGESLTLSASGDVVPPFVSNPVIAPSGVLLTMLARDDAGELVVPTNADFKVQWNGSDPGATLVVELSGADTMVSQHVYVDCSFDATMGGGTFPRSVLSPLTGAKNGAITTVALRETSVRAGPYGITFMVENTRVEGAASFP